MAAIRRVLFVAEKNDVAKGVAAILSKGTMTRREGRSKFNKIYQTQYKILGQDAILSITSVSGHLMNYEFGPEMKNWMGVPIGQLFDAPVHHNVLHDMKDIERTLREEAQKSDMLVIWTDCDREGENIGAAIAKVCTNSNRRLDVYRAKFSEITPRAIVGAVQNLVRIDQRIVDAVDCRSELDLRIGSAFTRLQTLHLRSRFPQVLATNTNGNQVVSYGSCQFPTLGFVVERYKAIEEFVSESFWKLVVDHTRCGTKVEFSWDRVRLFDRDVVNILYDDCREAQRAVIERITKKPKSRFRPQPLDTVELEKLAVRKLKMSAKTTMAIAEKLYNKGFISYPRTETNIFAKDIDLASLIHAHTVADDWGEFATMVEARGPHPRNGTKTDEAHPPIHPLKLPNRGELNGDDWRLYELIARHFLACVSWDAKGQETKVQLRIGGELFHASGLIVEELGYLKVYKYDKWSDKTLPAYVEGETLADYNLRIADGTTQPPQLLNEADLIALMEKFGIGTDATHADHIEKIKERMYVGVQEDGTFVPGFLGLALVDGYEEMGYAMSKPFLRADLEKGLKAICAGQRTKDQVLSEQKEKYRTIFVQTEARITVLSQALQRYLANRPAIVNAAPPPAAAAVPRGGAAPRARGGTRGRGPGRGASRAVQAPAEEVRDERPPRRGRGRGRGAAANDAGRGAYAGGAAAGALAANGQGKVCLCGLAAVQRKVNKEGPNKGRMFWCCSVPYGQPNKCNFFEWVT